MCGRPLWRKKNFLDWCSARSGADMCAAFDAAHTPQARMGVRGSGPNQAHALEAPVAKLVFLIPSQSLFECAISGTYANSAVIPQHRPSASSRLWPARPAAICLPDACGLGCDSHGSKDFSGKLLEFLTQTGSEAEKNGLKGVSRLPFSMRVLLENL